MTSLVLPKYTDDRRLRILILPVSTDPKSGTESFAIIDER